MSRRYIGMIIFIFTVSCAAWADTIYLKDGKMIEGEIIDQNNYSTKVMINGQPEIFYSGQIDRVVEDEKLGEAVNVDTASFEGISKQKAELIIQLLKLNGLTATLQKSVEQAIKNAPEERRIEFQELFNFDELVKILIPIFDVYYNEAELKELVSVYQNPVRKKEIENMPAVIKESLEKMIKHIYEKSNVK